MVRALLFFASVFVAPAAAAPEDAQGNPGDPAALGGLPGAPIQPGQPGDQAGMPPTPPVPPTGEDKPPGEPPTPGEGGDNDGKKGIVARLDAGTQKVDAPVVVRLKPEGGDLVELQLKDDGNPPDVSEGDGMWSGTLWATEDAFEISLSLGGTVIEGGPISWSPEDQQRDLALTLENGSFKAEALVAQPFISPTEGGAPGATPTEGEAATSLSATSAVLNPLQEQDDTTLYLALGAGALILGIIGFLWTRGRTDNMPKGLTLVPEPGLLGEGTPSLSNGFSCWVAPQDSTALLQPLLATMARHHRVIVVVPPRGSVPSVFGGPVYRVELDRPVVVGDTLDALAASSLGALTTLVVAEGTDPATLKKMLDALPEGSGGILLASVDPQLGLPTVTCTQVESSWSMTSGGQTFTVQENETGLVRQPG